MDRTAARTRCRVPRPLGGITSRLPVLTLVGGRLLAVGPVPFTGNASRLALLCGRAAGRTPPRRHVVPGYIRIDGIRRPAGFAGVHDATARGLFHRTLLHRGHCTGSALRLSHDAPQRRQRRIALTCCMEVILLPVPARVNPFWRDSAKISPLPLPARFRLAGKRAPPNVRALSYF